MKKIVSLVLSVVLLLSVCAIVVSADSPNNDVASDVQEGDIKNGSHVIATWKPFSACGLNGALHWEYIGLEYEYKIVDGKPQVTEVTYATTYVIGVNIIQWIPDNIQTEIVSVNSENDSIKISVSGEYLIGLSTRGAKIGFSIPVKWNETYTLDISDE